MLNVYDEYSCKHALKNLRSQHENVTIYKQFHSRIAGLTITTLFQGIAVSFVAKPHKLIFEQCDRDRYKFHTSCEVATYKLSIVSVGLSQCFEIGKTLS